MDILTLLEYEIGTPLPSYIKNLLVLNGFDNLTSISKINNEIIMEIENMVQNELSKMVEQDEIRNYLNVFNNPENFKFVVGHRILLLEMADIIRKKTVLYFQKKMKQSFNSNTLNDTSLNETNGCKIIQEITNGDESDFTINDVKNEISLKRPYSDDYPHRFQELEDRLLTSVNIWIKNSSKVENPAFVSTVKIIGELNESLDNIIGVVICGYCDSKIKVTLKGRTWIVTNYSRHFNAHFSANKKRNKGKIRKITAHFKHERLELDEETELESEVESTIENNLFIEDTKITPKEQN